MSDVGAAWRVLREGCTGSARWRDAPDDLAADVVAALVVDRSTSPASPPASITPDAATGARLAAGSSIRANCARSALRCSGVIG
jgi:hypothetical protein